MRLIAIFLSRKPLAPTKQHSFLLYQLLHFHYVFRLCSHRIHFYAFSIFLILTLSFINTMANTEIPKSNENKTTTPFLQTTKETHGKWVTILIIIIETKAANATITYVYYKMGRESEKKTQIDGMR